jgi:hypothetical protein
MQVEKSVGRVSFNPKSEIRILEDVGKSANVRLRIMDGHVEECQEMVSQAV